MSPTEAQILETLRGLPQPALEEVRVFLDFLTWRYQADLLPVSNADRVAAMRGKASTTLTTDEILELTRGER